MRSRPSQLQPRGGQAGLPLLLSCSSVYSAHPGGTRQTRTGAMAPPARSRRLQLQAASTGLARVSSLRSAELLGIIMRFITFPPITFPVFIRELGGSLGGMTCPGDTGKLALQPCSGQFELKLLLKLLFTLQFMGTQRTGCSALSPPRKHAWGRLLLLHHHPTPLRQDALGWSCGSPHAGKRTNGSSCSTRNFSQRPQPRLFLKRQLERAALCLLVWEEGGSKSSLVPPCVERRSPQCLALTMKPPPNSPPQGVARFLQLTSLLPPSAAAGSLSSGSAASPAAGRHWGRSRRSSAPLPGAPEWPGPPGAASSLNSVPAKSKGRCKTQAEGMNQTVLGSWRDPLWAAP